MTPLSMQRTWKYIYLCWGILCVVGGYRNLAPERTSHFDMPRSFIVFSFFFFVSHRWALRCLEIVLALNQFFNVHH